MPPRRTEFLYLPDNCPLTVIADADLHHIMKMQVINLVTVILHPLSPRSASTGHFPALHKAVLHFHLFLSAHTATPRIVTPSYHILFFSTSKPAEPATHLFPSYAWKQKTAEKASLSKSLSTVSFPSDRIFIMLLFLNHRQKYQRLVSFAGIACPFPSSQKVVISASTGYVLSLSWYRPSPDKM